MERQQSMHHSLFPMDAGEEDPAQDPALNPVLLPPRRRADVVGERPAGGTPQEVERANPGLAAAVPASVGKSGPTSADVLADVEQQVAPTTTAAAESAKGASGGGGGRQDEEAAGGAGGGLSLADASGMEVPELAVLPQRSDA